MPRRRERSRGVVAAIMQEFGKDVKAVARTMEVSGHATPMSFFFFFNLWSKTLETHVWEFCFAFSPWSKF